MKKNLAIFGAGIVVGAVAYAVWYKLRKKENIASGDFEYKDDNHTTDPTVPETVSKTSVEDDVDAMKNEVTHNMVARHEDAAQIMKDTVDIICKRSEVSEDENKELEQISSELDDLLSED